MNKEIEEALAERMAVYYAIEAMAKDLCRLPCECSHCVYPKYRRSLEKCKAMEYAQRAYAKGYRKQKVGRWTFSENRKTMKCPVCRLRMKTYDVRRYCPNCGAKMEGESDER